MIGSVIRILAAFAAAFFTGKAVSRLKLPSILGWLIAGMVKLRPLYSHDPYL